MNRIQRWTMVLGAVVLFSSAGCGSSKSGSGKMDASDGLCTQDTVTECVGPGNCQGMQICLVSGELGACVCHTPNLIDDEAGAKDAGKQDSGSGMTTRDAAAKTDSSVAAPPDASTKVDAEVHDAAPRVVEDCGNGVDDDGDGKVDCADEDCSARMCVAAAPVDWSGPVVLYVGSAATPTCGGSYTSEALRGGTAVSAAAPECSSCTCSSTNPGCASYLGFGFGAQSNCSDAACKASIDSSCVEIASSCLGSLTTGYVQTELPPDASSCMPSAQSPMIADATFSDHVLGCAAGEPLRRGGCGPGNLCAAEGPFSGPYCIVRSGDQACPAGPYTDKRVYFTAIDDMRDCSACTCGTDCSYSWKVYDDADATCQTPLSTSSSAGACTMVTPSSGKVRVGAAITGAGTCTPSGGQPTGSATAAGPVTACCLP